jgi:hypothetical protein
MDLRIFDKVKPTSFGFGLIWLKAEVVHLPRKFQPLGGGGPPRAPTSIKERAVSAKGEGSSAIVETLPIKRIMRFLTENSIFAYLDSNTQIALL